MNLVELIQLKYPNATNLIDYSVGDHGDGVLFISRWDLPDPQPDEDTINQWMQDAAINLQYLENNISEYLRRLIETKPSERGYDNVATLSSYVTSSNTKWKAEANAFIAWRDSVFNYAYNLLDNVKNNKVPIPTEEQFIAGIPVLTWPKE